MVLLNGVKYACERCIRGHRVTTCTHTDQPLTMIKPKGRPTTQCHHCREQRKMKSLHTACTCGKKTKNGNHSSSCACHITSHCTCTTTKKVNSKDIHHMTNSEKAKKKSLIHVVNDELKKSSNSSSPVSVNGAGNYVIEDIVLPFETGSGLFDLFGEESRTSSRNAAAGANGVNSSRSTAANGVNGSVNGSANSTANGNVNSRTENGSVNGSANSVNGTGGTTGTTNTFPYDNYNNNIDLANQMNSVFDYDNNSNNPNYDNSKFDNYDNSNPSNDNSKFDSNSNTNPNYDPSKFENSFDPNYDNSKFDGNAKFDPNYDSQFSPLEIDMVDRIFPLFPLVGTTSFDDDKNLPLLGLPKDFIRDKVSPPPPTLIHSTNPFLEHYIDSNLSTPPSGTRSNNSFNSGHSTPTIHPKPIRPSVPHPSHSNHHPHKPKRPESVLSMASNSSARSVEGISHSNSFLNGEIPNSSNSAAYPPSFAKPPRSSTSESFERVNSATNITLNHHRPSSTNNNSQDDDLLDPVHLPEMYNRLFNRQNNFSNLPYNAANNINEEIANTGNVNEDITNNTENNTNNPGNDSFDAPINYQPDTQIFDKFNDVDFTNFDFDTQQDLLSPIFEIKSNPNIGPNI